MATFSRTTQRITELEPPQTVSFERERESPASNSIRNSLPQLHPMERICIDSIFYSFIVFLAFFIDGIQTGV